MADLDTGNADQLANTIAPPPVSITSPLPQYTPPPVPTFEPPSLTTFNDQITDAKKRADAANASAVAQYQSASPILAALTSANQEIIRGKQMKAAEELRVASQIQEKDARFQLALGNTLGIGNTNITDIAAEIAATSKDIRMKDVALGKKMSVGFFDNPLQWLTNQFTLPGEARQLQAEGQQVETRLGILDTFTKASDDAHKMNVFTTKTDTATLIKATSMIIEGEERSKLFSAQMEALRSFNSGLDFRAVMAGRDFDNALKVQTAMYDRSNNAALGMVNYQFQVRQAGIEAHNLAVKDVAAEQERQLRIQQSETESVRQDIVKMQSADLKLKLEGEAELQTKIDRVSRLLNLPSLTVQTLNMYPAPLRDAVIGLATQQDGTQNFPRYGSDVVNSLTTYGKLPPGVTTASEYTVSKLMEAYTQAEKDAYHGATSIMDADRKSNPIVFHTKMLNATMNVLTNQMKDIKDTGGVFSPNPLDSTSKIAALKDNVIIGDLKPFLAVDPTHALKAQEVLDAAVKRIQEGKMTAAQAAAEINQIYQAVTLDVTQRNKLEQFGVQGLNSLTGFNTTVQASYGIISGRQKVDMTNPAAVTSILTRLTLNKELGAAATQVIP